MSSAWKIRFHAALDRFLSALPDAELRRRALLFIAFSLQGVIFGLLFAGFYLAIGHVWGALIVLICTAAMAGAPWIVRSAGLETAGNIYAFVLVAGFTGLTGIEGGIYGHAVAWLAVVPLCACILVGQQMGRLWCVICLAVMGVFCALELAGVRVPRLYPHRWENTITVAGYLSLTLFMSTVGIFFERGRRVSLQKLNGALDALSEANGRLSELDRERRAFLSMAAHDLRSPLNSIMGFSRLLQDFGPPGDEMQQDSLARIHSSGAQMRDLLDRLLSVQAIEEGKLVLKVEEVDLIALASTILENHRPTAAAKSIVLVFRPCDGPVVVEADTNAAIQILDNLLSNAIKFSPLGKLVTLRVLAPGGEPRHASIEVQDAGPGLSTEDQLKLYGKFVRLSARPTAGEPSNGLGLSIVKRLAEAMNGELTCRSKLGEGAAFCLKLRRVAATVRQSLVAQPVG